MTTVNSSGLVIMDANVVKSATEIPVSEVKAAGSPRITHGSSALARERPLPKPARARVHSRTAESSVRSGMSTPFAALSACRSTMEMYLTSSDGGIGSDLGSATNERVRSTRGLDSVARSSVGCSAEQAVTRLKSMSVKVEGRTGTASTVRSVRLAPRHRGLRQALYPIEGVVTSRRTTSAAGSSRASATA